MNGLFESQDLKRVRRAISDCVESRGWLAVVGDVGVGKTTAVDAALAGMPAVKLIEPLALDRERLRIGAILEAGIEDRSEERPRQSMEARARQWRRVVGQTAMANSVAMVLEEAHRLHPQTLAALKRLREIKWAGLRPILAIILVGQPELQEKLRRIREVGLRVRRQHMEGLTASEIGEYLEMIGYPADPNAAIEMHKTSSTPLAREEWAIEAWKLARLRKHKRIAVADLREVLAQDVAERIRPLGLSQGEIARRTGLSKATVSQALNGKHEASANVRAKIEGLVAEHEGTEHGVA